MHGVQKSSGWTGYGLLAFMSPICHPKYIQPTGPYYHVVYYILSIESSTSKKNINAMLPRKNRDTPFVHVISAMSAGFSASTTTNPIWLIKTRLQLDRATSKNRLTVKKSIIDIYKEAVSKTILLGPSNVKQFLKFPYHHLPVFIAPYNF